MSSLSKKSHLDPVIVLLRQEGRRTLNNKPNPTKSEIDACLAKISIISRLFKVQSKNIAYRFVGDFCCPTWVFAGIIGNRAMRIKQLKSERRFPALLQDMLNTIMFGSQDRDTWE